MISKCTGSCRLPTPAWEAPVVLKRDMMELCSRRSLSQVEGKRCWNTLVVALFPTPPAAKNCLMTAILSPQHCSRERRLLRVGSSGQLSRANSPEPTRNCKRLSDICYLHLIAISMIISLTTEFVRPIYVTIHEAPWHSLTLRQSTC